MHALNRISGRSYFVGGSSRVGIIELLGVKSKTEGGLDTGAEALSVS